MSLPATDNFNRADGVIGTNWTDDVGVWKIFSNAAYGESLNTNLTHWNADSFANDQYSQATAKGIGTQTPNTGPAVRCSTGAGGNCYLAAYVESGGTFAPSTLQKLVNGSFTSFQNLSAVANNDVLKIQVEGTTIKVYKNGVQDGTDQTDSALSSGSAGMFSYTLGNNQGLLDDWEGGNTATNATLTPSVGALALAGIVAKLNYQINMPDEL